ncbi:MAG: hypothetical protein ACR2IE_14545 [Candidatus Sumerlaeaceae bacterium]
MADRTIRAIPDKTTNRFAIHDVDSGELLHLFQSNREISKLTPAQMTEQENEAIRDFLVNGRHDDAGDDEPGW